LEGDERGRLHWPKGQDGPDRIVDATLPAAVENLNGYPAGI